MVSPLVPLALIVTPFGAQTAALVPVGAFGNGLTVMVIVVPVAHWPAFGVNVYVVVAVLFNAGDHVPVIPLFEVVGNADKLAPEQIAGT